MGHTLIPAEIALFDKEFNPVSNGVENTENTFHDPGLTYRAKAFARLMYGMSGNPSSEIDRLFHHNKS